jgi:hypothetical protein
MSGNFAFVRNYFREACLSAACPTFGNQYRRRNKR